MKTSAALLPLLPLLLQLVAMPAAAAPGKCQSCCHAAPRPCQRLRHVWLQPASCRGRRPAPPAREGCGRRQPCLHTAAAAEDGAAIWDSFTHFQNAFTLGPGFVDSIVTDTDTACAEACGQDADCELWTWCGADEG